MYRYRLVDSGGYYSEEAASDRLLQPPGEAIEQLVAQLNMLARGQEAWDAATTKDWLKGQGIALWNSFIPQALQREFWQRRDRITQMTIISQGDPVPWELLYPFAPGGQDAGFLIDQFPVARRRYGPGPPVGWSWGPRTWCCRGTARFRRPGRDRGPGRAAPWPGPGGTPHRRPAGPAAGLPAG